MGCALEWRRNSIRGGRSDSDIRLPRNNRCSKANESRKGGCKVARALIRRSVKITIAHVAGDPRLNRPAEDRYAEEVLKARWTRNQPARGT